MSQTDSKNCTAIRSLFDAFLRNRDRSLERYDAMNIAAYLMYASYISRNADMFDVLNLDPVFKMDTMCQHLGNDYVASQFLDAYSELRSPICELPSVRLEPRQYYDLQSMLLTWADLLRDPNLSLKDDESLGTARCIARVMEEVFTEGVGKSDCQWASYAPLASLVVSLADVEGKSVYDPACGNGVFLAEAAFKGAASLRGGDVDGGAAMRAKLLAFFSDPCLPVEIATEDSLRTGIGSRYDRIVCTPPFGMRLPRGKMSGYAEELSEALGIGAFNGSYGEDLFIAKALAELAEDGVAVIQVVSSFLYHQQRARRELREALVSQGHISAVVELPGGCAPGTAVVTSLIVLTRKPQDGDVLLVDMASKTVEDKGYFDQSRRMCVPTEAGIEWIADVVRSRREVPGVSILVSRDRIVQTDCSLRYSTYGEVPASGVSYRPTELILSDIDKAQREVEALGVLIGGILTALQRDDL